MATGGSGSVCPECDEPIGDRSTFCLHCGEELPERADGDAAEETDGSGESLLTRLRPGTATESAEARDSDDGRSASAARPTETSVAESASESTVGSDRETAAGHASRTSDRTDASGGLRSWLPSAPKTVAATVAVPTLVLLFAFSTTVAGAVGALLAWLAFSVVVYRQEPGADAVPKIAAGFVLFALFVPIGVMFARSDELFGVAAGLAMILVPAGFALWNVLVE